MTIGAIGSPAMLSALALVAVPIILHILARRRHTTVRWAAMDLLERADRRLRRKLELKDLILLALRVAAIVFAVFAVAGVVVPGDGALGSLARSNREIVLVFDRSPSMDARSGDQRRLGQAITTAEALLASLDASARVTVCAFDSTLTVLGRAESPAAARERLEHVEIAPTPDRPGVALRSLSRELRARDRAVDVLVFSHFPASTWHFPASTWAGRGALAVTSETDRGHPVRWRLVRSPPAARGNLRVIDVRGRPARPRVGEAGELVVRVENTDGAPSGRRVLRTTVDGREVDVRALRLGAGEQTAFVIPHRPAAAGHRAITVRADPDVYPGDDCAYTVWSVLAPATVALVERDRADARPFGDPLDFVRLALTTASGDEGDPGRHTIERRTADSLRPCRFAIVSPAAARTPQCVARLRAVSRAGGTVLFVAGPTDAEAAWPDASLAGLDGAVTAFDPPAHLVVTDAGRRHPAIAFLAADGARHLARARVYTARRPRALPRGARVLIRADDPERTPILIAWNETPGGGPRLWWTSSLSPAWTDLPTPAGGNHAFVPLMLGLLGHATAAGPAPGHLLPGDPFGRRVRPGERLLAPDGTPCDPTTPAGRRAHRPGIYRYEGSDPTGLLAVNATPEESAADDADAAALRTGVPDARVDANATGTPQDRGRRLARSLESTDPAPRSLDHVLLALAGAALVLEMLLAYVFGRERR